MSENVSARESWSKLAGLTWQAAELQVRLARDLAGLTRTALTSDKDPVVAGLGYVDELRKTGEQYWRDTTGLGLDYTRELVAFGSAVGCALAGDVSTVFGPAGETSSGGAVAG